MTYTDYLDLFNYILTNGTQKNSKTYFDGFCAWHDIDGYTCYLQSNKVTLTLLFHSRTSYEYEQNSNLSEFQQSAKNMFNTIQLQRLKH